MLWGRFSLQNTKPDAAVRYLCMWLCTQCVSPLSFMWLIIFEAWQEDRFISCTASPLPSLSLFPWVSLSLSFSPSCPLPPIGASKWLSLRVCQQVFVCMCAEVCVMCDLAALQCLCAFISILLIEVNFKWWHPNSFFFHVTVLSVCVFADGDCRCKLTDAHTHTSLTHWHTQKCMCYTCTPAHSQRHSVSCCCMTHTHTSWLCLFEVWR